MKHNFNINELRITTLILTLCSVLMLVVLIRINSSLRLSSQLAVPERTVKNREAPSFVSDKEDTLVYRNGLFVRVGDIDPAAGK